MDCTTVRRAVSARLDEEDLALEPGDVGGVEDHLRACPGCAAWAEHAALLRRRALLLDLPDAPDLSPRVLAAAMPVRVARRSRQLQRARVLRTVLAVTGALLVAGVAVVAVLGPDAVQPAEHLTSTTALWAACVGLGLLTVAGRPRLGFALAPLLATAATFLVIATIDDLVNRHVHPVHETPTVIAAAGLAALLLLIWPERHRGSGRTPPRVPDADAPGVDSSTPRRTTARRGSAPAHLVVPDQTDSADPDGATGPITGEPSAGCPVGALRGTPARISVSSSR